MTEWVRHYRAEGVSQFVLIDDNSTDSGGDIARSLDCTVVPSLGPHSQDASYREHVHLLRTDWMLVADLDEFVYARGPGASIASYLGTLTSSNCGAVQLPWVMYASSNLRRHPVSVVSASTIRASTAHWRINVKTLTRRAHLCDAKWSFDLHRAMVRSSHCLSTSPPTERDLIGGCANWPDVARAMGLGNFSARGAGNFSTRAIADAYEALAFFEGVVPDASQQLRMNHYPLQSWEFFCRIKMTRGSADTEGNARDVIYYEQENHGFAGEVDTELSDKRGAAFAAALPSQRTWPPETADDAECESAGAPAEESTRRTSVPGSARRRGETTGF